MGSQFIYPQSSEAFKNLSDFEKNKYLYFLPTLSNRLNIIHDLNEDDMFWEQVLGMTLLFHVSQCSVAYNNLIKMNDIKTDENISILIPRDELAYRDIYCNSVYGENILINVFTHTKIKYLDLQSTPKNQNNTHPHNHLIALIRKIKIKYIFRKLLNVKDPITLLIEVNWSKDKINNLLIKSFGRVQVDEDWFAEKYFAEIINVEKRKILSKKAEGGDKFDQYFYHTLFYSAPTTWIETFKFRYNRMTNYLNKYKNLKHIINESMSPNAMLLIAIARKRRIRTYYCEHNYLQQHFIGNLNWFTKRKFDLFLTVGWMDVDCKKTIPLSSNFAWHEKAKRKFTINILYVTTLAQIKMPYMGSGYGETGNGRNQSFINMKKSFFNILGPELTKQIYYKDYPLTERNKLSEHPINFEFRTYIMNKVHTYDESTSMSMLDLMNYSRICICDYLSTPYNQMLLSNIPTIVLFNPDTYYLIDEEKDFYKDLIDANIFQPNPSEAATFLKNIYSDIDTWWESEQVQTARKNYITKNFGEQYLLTNYINNLN